MWGECRLESGRWGDPPPSVRNCNSHQLPEQSQGRQSGPRQALGGFSSRGRSRAPCVGSARPLGVWHVASHGALALDEARAAHGLSLRLSSPKRATTQSREACALQPGPAAVPPGSTVRPAVDEERVSWAQPPPPALPRPLPPSRPLLPSTTRSVWRLPYSGKGKAEHNLSLCNYLSGTACEASATSPQPCKKINYTQALGDTDGTTLPSTLQQTHLWQEHAAQASPGLLIPALRPPDTHPPSSRP